jgi:hypothetical protein
MFVNPAKPVMGGSGVGEKITGKSQVWCVQVLIFTQPVFHFSCCVQVFTLKGLSALAHHARTTAGLVDPDVDSHVLKAAFATLTNVNFDDARFEELINQTLDHHARLAKMLAAAGVQLPQAPTHTPW